jgi:hypothetical protein
MPTINVYLTEEQYLEYLKIKKPDRKTFLAWALDAYLKAKAKKDVE